MAKFLLFSRVLIVALAPVLVQGIKIAFVGDTGIEDESSLGYGDRTMKMIEDENVDLVVDVGDFDYWGRCTETYQVRGLLTIDSLTGQIVELPYKSTLKRIKWQDGKHGSIEGWEIGVQPSSEDALIVSSKKLTIDGDLFQRHVISHKTWEEINDNLKLQWGERNCYGEPWDGPWIWNQFLRNHSFDFLGASGNAEVKEAPLYGSAEIWSSHQEYLHELYMERIYNTNRGACHGYTNQTEPGSVDEYGERYSCYYKNNRGKEDFQFLFLGWWQGSNERTDNGSKEIRKNTIEFIEREFSEKRSQKVRWRFCIQHMTSAKLSSGDKNRDNMVLARITDTCRKHGAIILSGHHHLYSRTKMLQSVGSESGEDPIPVDDANADESKFVVSEGVTMSITTGMGGYDGGCNGKYWNATWMDRCIARPSDHRGAIIAEFEETNTRIGNFRYMNSLKNGNVVDEFQITSRLPGSKTKAPTNKPTRKPSRKPTRTPTESLTLSGDSRQPTRKPIVEFINPFTNKEPTRRPTRKPSGSPTESPTSSGQSRQPTRKPISDPSSTSSHEAELTTKKPTEIEKDYSDEGCILVMDLLCSFDNFSNFCELIDELDLDDLFSPIADNLLTVFAPNNKAFEALEGNEEFDFNTLTTKQSIYVLLYHVVAMEGNSLTYADLECGLTTETLNGESARTKCSGDDKFQRGPKQMDNRLPKIIVPNIDVCNGVVHVVDHVILPNLDKIP